MKKSIIIGVIVLAIIAIIIASASSLNYEINEESPIENIEENEIVLEEEIIPVEENTGRDLSVELSESMGLSSP